MHREFNYFPLHRCWRSSLTIISRVMSDKNPWDLIGTNIFNATLVIQRNQKNVIEFGAKAYLCFTYFGKY